MYSVTQFLNRGGTSRFPGPDAHPVRVKLQNADDIETDLLVDEPAAATPAPERERSLVEAARFAVAQITDPKADPNITDAVDALALAVEAAEATGDTSAIAADYHAARQALPEATVEEVCRSERFDGNGSGVGYFVNVRVGDQRATAYGITLSVALSQARLWVNKVVADAEAILAAEERKRVEWDRDNVGDRFDPQ